MLFDELLQLCRQKQLNPVVDSRRLHAGDIFIAVNGENQDGGQYIVDAASGGASFVVCLPEHCEKYSNCLPAGCELVSHQYPREAVWMLANARWRNLPQTIIGITGTNGKTTTAYLLEWLFSMSGSDVGVMGTINYRWPRHSENAPLTTPDAVELYSRLELMAQAGVKYAIMEVSSHALAQKRVGGIPFGGAIFTNLTQDHLDFHKDMESYFRAKASLFLALPKSGKAMAINSDDPYGRRLAELAPDAITFGHHSTLADNRHLVGEILRQGMDGLHLKMKYGKKTWELRSHLIGDFNALNLLGVQALALGLGLEPDQMEAMASFPGVPGRLERIANDRGLNIFVDYAHTPDALTKALEALKKSGFRKIITVFGCGGNRDKSKRPLMGEAVARLSDIAILTSDNPRFEEPEAIMADVRPGLKSLSKVIMDADRRSATKKGIDLLEKDDVLLIAGKGHEDYQIVQGVKNHYSDQEVCREILNCVSQ